MFKGLVRIKCIDIANWAAMNNKLTDLPEGIRVATEGMETLSIYPEAAETMDGLRANMKKALEFGIERYGEHDKDTCTLMKMLANDMEDGLMDQSYGVQYRYPNAPYIDIVLKEV